MTISNQIINNEKQYLQIEGPKPIISDGEMDLKETLRSIADQKLSRDRFMRVHTNNAVYWAKQWLMYDDDVIYLVAGWGDDPDQVDYHNQTELDRALRVLKLKREADRREG